MRHMKTRLWDTFHTWNNARKAADDGILLEQAPYRKELDDKENQAAAAAQADFHRSNNGLQLGLHPREQEKERLEREIEGTEQGAGDEPRIPPDVPPWLDWVVAIMAALVEFAISVPVLAFLNLPTGLAVTLAFGISIATLWMGHRFGAAVRKQVKSRRAANFFIMAVTLGCALPLAFALMRLRQNGFEEFHAVQNALIGAGNVSSTAALRVTAASEGLVLLLVTLSMLFLAAIFHFDVDYAGARWGMKRLERQLHQVQKEIHRLEAQVEALAILYQAVCGGIAARFNKHRHAYERIYTHRLARLRRKEEE